MQEKMAFDDIKLCAFVVASNIYENGKSIYQSFLPLLETTLDTIDNLRGISLLEFQTLINDTFKVKIPKATLQRLIDELEREGKVRFERKRVIYSTQNVNSASRTELREKSKEITNLFLAFREYMLRKDKIISYEEAKGIICKYIFSHCYDLIDFIGGIERPPFNNSENSDVIFELCDFLFECREHKAENYNAIINLYNGAIQATLLNFDPDKIDNLQNNDFLVNSVVLDTNFLMRLLDIQTENEYIAAMETLETLKSAKCKIVVLRESLLETISSIRSFLHEDQQYAADTQQYYRSLKFKPSGLLSAIQRGKSRNDLLQLTNYERLKTTVESRFEAIVIEQHDTYSLAEDEITSLIRYKNNDGYGRKQAEHDLLLISYCKSLRGDSTLGLKDAKNWVLTNDIKLAYWNQQNCDNVQECITETQLSNLLWLMSRKHDNIGLANTMVAISNNELLDQKTFYKFAFQMKRYKEVIKDDPEKVDKLSIVFACNSITEDDIRKISSEPLEIDKIIYEKAEQILKEQKDKDLELSQNQDATKTLQNDLRNIKTELEISRIENLVLIERENLRNFVDNDTKLNFKMDQLNNVIQFTPKAVREVGLFLLCSMLLLSALGYLIMRSVLLNNIMVALNALQSVNAIVLEILLLLFFPILSFIAYLIGLICIGKPFELKHLVNHLCDIRIRQFKKRNDISFDNSDIHDEKKKISMLISSNNDELIKCKERIQDNLHKIDILRQDILSEC